uniref:Uncharacterized protein n=1 Tax=Anopheles maculatus TaxID=74869 RepID=A0A182T8K4_9DIPT
MQALQDDPQTPAQHRQHTIIIFTYNGLSEMTGCRRQPSSAMRHFRFGERSAQNALKLYDHVTVLHDGDVAICQHGDMGTSDAERFATKRQTKPSRDAIWWQSSTVLLMIIFPLTFYQQHPMMLPISLSEDLRR